MKTKTTLCPSHAGSHLFACQFVVLAAAGLGFAACQDQEASPVEHGLDAGGSPNPASVSDPGHDDPGPSSEEPSLTLDQWKKAIEQRDRLPAAAIGGDAAGAGPEGTLLAAPPTSQWKFIGPQNTGFSGRVNGMAIWPCSPSVRYLASAEGGVWKTKDGGMNWFSLSDSWPSLSTSSVAVHPTNCADTNRDVVLVGTGDFDGGFWINHFAPLGVMRSADGGATWAQVTDIPPGLATSAILFDPDNANIVLAAQGHGLGTIGTTPQDDQGWVWRSTDAGVHWSPTATNNGTGVWSSMSIGRKDASGRRTYVTGQQNGGTVLRSDDRGALWTNCDPLSMTTPGNRGTAIEVAASRWVANTVYVLVGQEDFGLRTRWSLYRHDNACIGGLGWQPIVGAPDLGPESAPAFDAAIAVGGDQGTGDIVYVCGQEFQSRDVHNAHAYRSTAGWTDVPMGHADCHAIVMSDSNPNYVIFANDGGLFDQLYDPNNKTQPWFSKALDFENKTIGITQLSGVGTHPGDLTQVVAGAQDNRTFVSWGTSSFNLHTWTNTYEADGGFAAFDRVKPSIVYGAANGNFGRNDATNPLVISDMTNGLHGSHDLDVGAYAPDPGTPGRMYAATLDGVFALDPAATGASWQLQTTLGYLVNDDFPRAIAVAPSNPNIVYAATNFGHVIRVDLSVSSTTVISNDLPDLGFWSFHSISVNPNDASDILVGTGRAGQCDQADCGVAGLWRCSNASARFPTWSAVDGRFSGLAVPDGASIGAIARDPDDPASTWYVTSLLGVFQTTDAGETWANAGAPLGLPNVWGKALEINPVTRYMTVGTFGRGIWRIKLAGGTLPDLIVTAQSASHVTGGIRFSATIKNQGTAATPNNVIHNVTFWLDGTTRASTNTSMTSLGVGASRTLTATWSTTTRVTGSHSLKVVVDNAATELDNRISESNETNNTRTVTVPL